MPTTQELIGNNRISYMIMSIPGNTLDEKLLQCTCCLCCKRHTVDRPFLLAPFEIIEPREKEEAPCCPCNCRHAARYICRLIDEQNKQFPNLHYYYFQHNFIIKN